MMSYYLLILSLATLIWDTIGLSNGMCKTYDNQTLPLNASSVVKEANELLLSYKIFNGLMINIVDEDDGEEAGGGTNTKGSYQTLLFNGTEVFPPGMCDIPDSHGSPRCDTDSGATIAFLLGPADVVAFYVCSPPSMRYYSYDTIIDTRLTEDYPFYPGQPFGDTISNAKINTSDSEDHSPFDQPILIIQSADLTAAEDVANAYIATNKVDPAAISIRGIDSSTVRLWDRSAGQTWEESQPDVLSVVSRMAIPLDAEPNSSYDKYKGIVWPASLYLAGDEVKAVSPAKPALLSRESKAVVNEVDTLSDSFSLLKQSITDSNMNAVLMGIQTVNLTEEGYYDDWDVILERRNNDSFAVPTRDATYGLPVCLEDGACKLDSTTSAVVIGVLHKDVLNAAYNSVGVSVMNVLNSKYLETHWIVDTDLRGSAERYLSGSGIVDTDADSLFAIDFMPPGKCEGSSFPQWCVEFNATSMARVGVIPYLILGERVYAVGDTMIGPLASEMIGTELLVFSQ